VSIRTGVLALAPTLYWPLDDPSGPAASDASGNGHPGVYGGGFSLGQNGPEANTTCCLFTSAGDVATLGATPVLAPPWTMIVWLAARSLTGLGTALIYNGDGDVNGSGLVWEQGNQGANQLALLRGGVSSFNTGYQDADQIWHQFSFIRDGAAQIAVYVDGAAWSPLQAGGAFNAIPGTSKFHVGPGLAATGEYVAHAALWNSVLTPAQISGLFSARTNPTEPIGSPVGIGAELDLLIKYVSRLYQNAP
jgi:hypothetical protein